MTREELELIYNLEGYKLEMCLIDEGLLTRDYKYIDLLYWEYITVKWANNADFINEYHDKIQWDLMSWKNSLPLQIIHKYKEKFNWAVLTRSFRNDENLSEIASEFKEYLDWKKVKEHWMMDADFINQYKEYLEM